MTIREACEVVDSGDSSWTSVGTYGMGSSWTAGNGPYSLHVSREDSSSSVTTSWTGGGDSEVSSAAGGSTFTASLTDAWADASGMDTPWDSEFGSLSESSGGASFTPSRGPVSGEAWCAS
ncbi:hypothetical protein PF011_g17534 [Phytophthora fragariae]|uniref:Uncharacterized protein n=1 Tax=Phytophthora fragariae TaxID=53985 RepID=A0A6A3JG51_9STRA|nr:hypothetical protein PF011_g17534 [Phytophthora fragariae]